MHSEDLNSFYQFLETISRRGIHCSLDRMQQAVQFLGQPQKKYPIIHVAGTNGKGSTCQFTAQMLSLSGHKVGLTLSPHVDDFRERIQLSEAGSLRLQMISEKDLLKTHQILLKKIPSDLELTYYEWSILMALKYFQDQQVAFVVLETGMGGRWDATNVCDSMVSGITTVGFDHMEYLGNTLAAICTEKLQIVTKNSDFIFGPMDESLIQLAREYCEKMGAHYHHASVRQESGKFRRRGYGVPGLRLAKRGEAAATSKLSRFLPDTCVSPKQPRFLPGTYEDNFNFAFEICHILKSRGVFVDFEKITETDNFTLPPARLEQVCSDPPVILDGAHNEPALLELKKYLDFKTGGQYDLVFGCTGNRDFLKLAKIVLSPHRNYWAHFEAGPVTPGQPLYLKTKEQLGGEIVDLDRDFITKLKTQKSQRPIIVCGSFYLCAQFRKVFVSCHPGLDPGSSV